MEGIEFFKFSIVVFCIVVGYILFRDRKQVFVKKSSEEVEDKVEE